jgi:hypothetical protein
MKINSARRLTSVILLLSMTLAGSIAFTNDANIPDVPLNGALDLTYVGHLEKTDDDGLLLEWEGSIGGDFAGKIKWWFIDPSPVITSTYKGGKVDYYKAKWEIWVGGKLVLTGKSAGKTVTPDQSDGLWDGHGIVTEAYGTFAGLKGHKVYETGAVIYGSNPPISFTCTGMFQIY